MNFKNGLAISYEKLGSTHTKLGNLQQALKYFVERNNLAQELHNDYPTNVNFKNGLAISYSKLGWFYKNQLKDNTKARLYFEKYLALREELARDFPGFAEFVRGLELARNAMKSLEE
ncbi:MAG: tetratricopeptide repeat protein [Saprospiraceae bacterium]|nr:tetratricopeptide repeat protein [Saprospiraceae bacterium]